ncbi:hypothetical protein TNCV_2110261 [Trichonephila clavipes]|nr:hypothetical protein TNCV_2110261 [Trichonephila clavipes]
MVSFLDVTGIKPCPDLSPNQNALRIASGTEPTLIREEDTTPLTVVQFLCSLHHCKRWRRWPTFNRRQRSGRRANRPPLMIYRSSPAVVVLGRPPPTLLTAVPVLDTLRENCGIIRKQASTDCGVLWKVVRVNVVQVRRKDRSLRDPREARSRVRVLDESRSFFRVHTGYFSNIPKCIKAAFIASWACSQSSVVSSSKR